MRIAIQLENIKKFKRQLYQIAARYGISKVYVFGSTPRGESSDISDGDFQIEMEADVSALGVGAFQFETQQLQGVHIDSIPMFTLSKVEYKTLVQSVQSEAVALYKMRKDCAISLTQSRKLIPTQLPVMMSSKQMPKPKMLFFLT